VNTKKLALLSQRIALLTLLFMASMLLLNMAFSLWPNLTSVDGGYGLLANSLVP